MLKAGFVDLICLAQDFVIVALVIGACIAVIGGGLFAYDLYNVSRMDD